MFLEHSRQNPQNAIQENAYIVCRKVWNSIQLNNSLISFSTVKWNVFPLLKSVPTVSIENRVIFLNSLNWTRFQRMYKNLKITLEIEFDILGPIASHKVCNFYVITMWKST